MFLSLFVCVFMLFSCQKEEGGVESPSDSVIETNQGTVGCYAPQYNYTLEDAVEISKNAFTAELLEYNKLENNEVKMKLKIDTVFKGEYFSGDEIECSLPTSESLLNENVGAVVNGKYFFTTGTDPIYFGKLGNTAVRDILSRNIFDVVRIDDDGSLKYHPNTASRRYGTKDIPETYEEIESRLLCLEQQTEYFQRVWKKEHLTDAFEVADNVYLGRILEVQPCNEVYNGIVDYKIVLQKIKVEIKHVYKGNYVTGEIVEDVICDSLNSDNYDFRRNMLIISGGTFDVEGFGEESEIWDNVGVSYYCGDIEFESGRYIIKNNFYNVVLTCDEETNLLVVEKYTGDKSQIWTVSQVDENNLYDFTLDGANLFWGEDHNGCFPSFVRGLSEEYNVKKVRFSLKEANGKYIVFPILSPSLASWSGYILGVNLTNLEHLTYDGKFYNIKDGKKLGYADSCYDNGQWEFIPVKD